MDRAVVLNIAALVVSLAAFAVSVLFTRRQIKIATGATHMAVVLNAFQDTRDDCFFEAENYILKRMSSEYSPELGYRKLPESVRGRATKVGIFYDDLGKLVAHDMISQSLVIGSYGTTIVRLWDVLAPYVYSERIMADNHFWIYFEDLAARTAAISPDVVYADLGLRSRPPGRTSDAG